MAGTVTFKVWGDDEHDLLAKAHAQLASYVGPDDARTWELFMDTSALQLDDGSVVTWEATVTAATPPVTGE